MPSGQPHSAEHDGIDQESDEATPAPAYCIGMAAIGSDQMPNVEERVGGNETRNIIAELGFPVD
jgi:hypothetical protein